MKAQPVPAFMSLLTANLAALQIHQPEAWSLLKDRYDSPFELADGEVHFLGRSWPIQAPAPETGAPVAAYVYGLGDGTWVRELRARLGPQTPILVLDSQPDLAWACLTETRLDDLFADPALQWLVDPPDKLVIRFHEACQQMQDRLGLAWLENPPVAAIAGLLNDAFLTLFRDQAKQWGGLDPLAGLTELEKLYARLGPEMTRAYDSYALSCRSGCAGCCKGSVGFHLCLNPLEWGLAHRALMALPEARRREVFVRSARTLAHHTDFLVELLYYFDTQPERVQDPAFHLELLRMAGERRQEPCVFLDAAEACEVYSGRPFTCRVFGNSHVQGVRPFTCDLDYEQMEKILLDEGAGNHLVDSHPHREQLWALHKDQPYKQVLHWWVLTHLDFERQDFGPLRLDYQQFQGLVRDEARLDALLEQLAQFE